MIGRGGVTVGGLDGRLPTLLRRVATLRVRLRPLEKLCGARRPLPWLSILACVVVVATVLAFLPGRTRIPPLIESDYCYLLTAADRMYEGLGPTAPLPVAPFQPWTWQVDWGFLTQWPIGYPILICAFRWLLGLSTIQACQWISVLGCATALAGWFVWIKRNTQRGVSGVLLAGVGAGCSVSTASLINPSTDLLLVAALPFVFLFTAQAIERRRDGLHMHDAAPSPKREHRRFNLCQTIPDTHASKVAVDALNSRAILWLALAGLTAGGLFWIRYASVFVPVAIGLFLLVQAFRARVRWGAVAVFAVSAAAPIVTLLLINRAFGTAASIKAQLNLGDSARFAFSLKLLTRAWWNLTDLSFYDYHWFSHSVYAIWPFCVMGLALVVRPIRKTIQSFFATPGIALSTYVLVALLVMLIGATAVFGGKYDYVGLDRYYVPGRPLYFLLFGAPILLVPRRIVRAVVSVGLLVACSWLVQQEWPRPFMRWLTAGREVTPYGQWAVPFSPNAGGLYEWLGERAAPDLIVISNFHEYITLETKIPALPIPKDVPTLHTWVDRIRIARSISNPRVLFVLDPDNRQRAYWLPPPAEVLKTFAFKQRRQSPEPVSALIFEYRAPAAMPPSATP